MAAPTENPVAGVCERKTQSNLQISENMTDEGRSVRVEKNESHLANTFQMCTDFIDEHIRLFRTSISVTAAIGLLVIARSIRVYQRFRRVSDIPEEFISKNMKLYGRFVALRKEPVHVIVQHTPIVNFEWRQKRESDSGSGLPVHLAGLELQEGSLEYLQDRLGTQPSLRFHMLCVNEANGLDCIVDLVKWKLPFRRTSLNEELLRQGLAKVSPLGGLRDHKLQTRLTQRLLAAELRAEKKSRGVWTREREPTKLDVARAGLVKVRDGLTSGVAVLVKVVTLPWRGLSNLRDFLRRKSDGES
ncbi:protein C3orf33-like [Patiria miniata]|uniref:TNase-like domain-containing protein n=1 Tax=Patiria miniata TaxID=46514 RepID=A0A914AD64_PATMI|nr:protein C3orf33-like [Patiria miniata]